MKDLKRRGALLLCGLLTAGIAPGTRAQPPDSYAISPDRPATQTKEQMRQLVAPIALYPDALVGQILAASLYPAQIVQANRWLKDHSDLKGEQLAQEVNRQSWDPSVRALTQFPDVLANLDSNLSWTSSLGDAYVNQPQDVLNAVQDLRKKAEKSGSLKSNAQEKVTTQGQTIIIEPANPQVVYVPTYDPWLAYGYAIPVYPGWYPYGGLYVNRPGISFGIGFGVGAFLGFGWGWNHWGADWHHNTIIYNHNTYINRSNTNNTTFNHYGGYRPGGAGYAGIRPYTAPHFNYGSHSSAFSGYNHGGVTQSYSTRGHVSLGGGVSGGYRGSAGGVSGGFHGRIMPLQLTGHQNPQEGKSMTRKRFTMGEALRFAAALTVFPGTFCAASASAQQPNQRVFATTAQAGHALVMALQNQDKQALKSLFGTRTALLASDDGLQDGRDRERFLTKYREMHRLVKEPDGRVLLYVGAENWPFPVPLMAAKNGWYFDTDAGMEEMACRNIGANEMNAMREAKAYARGRATLAANGKTLRNGYYFCAAPGGVNGAGGVALAAYPAEYRVTGVKTFLVSAKGVVYEKDLGVNTARRVKAMTRYRVDSSWTAAR
ncbi:uncharacterized protein KY384_000071 [Bacidia gigantensis]|uniref:uncharacterized protein n=1 Tax=Bacidia gigantensis TaxID=2732470 RepID=UPI001D0518BB|nr:uncharacterized protein KY384_000071 [Bacidia gigantensis]KAG8526079.1 hypothetical protein KY384_000071 [Bacidia gigantensis]